MRPGPVVVVVVLLATAAAAVVAGRRGGGPRGGESPSLPGNGPAITPPVLPRDGGDLFRDVTAESGIDFVHVLSDGAMDNVVEAVGAGGAWLDYDGDGRLDLYLVNGGWREGLSRGERPRDLPGNRLYRNRGDGTFEDVTGRAGVGDRGFGVAAAAGDVDGDGRVDLYVVNDGPNVLYRNRGDGTFEDVTTRAGVGDGGCGVAALLLDADGDRWPDLFVVNYLTYDASSTLHFAPDGFPGPLTYRPEASVLYRNRGDGTFEDVTEAAGLGGPRGRGMGAAAADLDGDGRTDIFVANDAGPNLLFRGEGGGRFTERALEAGVAYGMQGEATAAMAGAVADYDGDGLPDLLVTDTAYGSLFRNRGGGLFEDRAFVSGVAAPSARHPSWGAAWLDADNDGDVDLFIANGDLHHAVGREDLFLENRGDGTFADASARAGAWFAAALNGRACLPADYDDDGDVDLLVTHVRDRVALLRNDAPRGNSWITLALAGRPPATGALGAVVAVTAGGRTLRAEARTPSVYLGQGDPRIHFGLGESETVDRIEVRWPSGGTTVMEAVPARRVVGIREGAER